MAYGNVERFIDGCLYTRRVLSALVLVRVSKVLGNTINCPWELKVEFTLIERTALLDSLPYWYEYQQDAEAIASLVSKITGNQWEAKTRNDQYHIELRQAPIYTYHVAITRQYADSGTSNWEFACTHKIAAIKVVREICDTGLKEAKDLVEQTITQWDVFTVKVRVTDA